MGRRTQGISVRVNVETNRTIGRKRNNEGNKMWEKDNESEEDKTRAKWINKDERYKKKEREIMWIRTAKYLNFKVCSWRNSSPPPLPPQWAVSSLFTRFLDHIQRPAILGRTPLDEWSVLGRDLYLTTHTKLTTYRYPCTLVGFYLNDTFIGSQVTKYNVTVCLMMSVLFDDVSIVWWCQRVFPHCSAGCVVYVGMVCLAISDKCDSDCRCLKNV